MSETRTDWIGAEKIKRPEDITPDVLDRIAFTQRFGGYKVSEVDEFIDHAADRLTAVLRENETLRAEAAREVVPEVRTALNLEQLMGEVTAALLACNENARRAGKRAVVSPSFLVGVAEAVAAAILTAPIPPLAGEDVGLLTEAEHRVINLLGQVWTVLVQEIVEPDRQQAADLAELVAPIHTIQNAVLAQAAARAYPDRYRRLGTTMETPDE